MIQITATYQLGSGTLSTQTGGTVSADDVSYERIENAIAGALYGIDAGPVRLSALFTDTLLGAAQDVILTTMSSEEDGDALDAFASEIALALGYEEEA